MTELLPIQSSFDDTTMLRLAREISMDIRPIEDILTAHGVSQVQWDALRTHQRFNSYLRGFKEEWESAANTSERVKVKSMAFVEELLPEFYARAHDAKENLTAKVEVLKTVAKFAGIGVGSVDSNIGERLSVTINIGEGQQLKIERDVTPRVIEGDEL